jgi:hypothetical protein
MFEMLETVDVKALVQPIEAKKGNKKGPERIGAKVRDHLA